MREAMTLLVLLQAVLGFDNLLYISLESKRVPAERQAFVRRMGIGLAVGVLKNSKRWARARSD